tara:strand:+ start:11 stop:220 length:210 start_codon:yes stop_codon:yes gene_type:complete
MSCRLFKIRKGSSKKYIYAATDSNNDTIYWSDNEGWGEYKDASLYNKTDVDKLKWPSNHKWIPVEVIIE